MLFLQVAIAIYILLMFIYLILNTRGYSEVPAPSALPESPPTLSVIVATHNNREAITNCLNSLGRQDYPNMEIIVMDERSQDGTPTIVKDLASEYSNIHFFPNDEAPADWSGKTYGLHAGSLKARGDWLLFLEPSVVIQPQCISRCVAYCLDNEVDFFSLMPGHRMESFWEKLILPITFGWFGTRFSIAKVNDRKSTQAVAVSQFMLIHQKAYRASGGFEKAKKEILEDSALAREIKEMGMTYRLMGGKNLMTNRVYGGLKEIWQTWSRIFVGEIGSSPVGILWTTLVIGLTGIAPFASILWYAYVGLDTVDLPLLVVLFGQCAMVLGARLVLDTILGIGPFYAFLHPIGAFFALAVLLSSLYRTTVGSLEHVKGRVSSEL